MLYYVADERAPKTDEGGRHLMFRVPVRDVEIWVLHADYLPQLEAYARGLGCAVAGLMNERREA